MMNIDHHSPTMGPRISFSNDFADAVKIQNSTNYKEAPVSADFEFSVTNFNAFSSVSIDSSAEEIFFMGKLLPLKERKTTATATTLRDELLVNEVDLITQIPKGFSRWKDRFSLTRRSCNEMKKSERRDGCLESVAEEKTPTVTLILDNKHHVYTMKKFAEERSDSDDLTIGDVKELTSDGLN